MSIVSHFHLLYLVLLMLILSTIQFQGLQGEVGRITHQ